MTQITTFGAKVSATFHSQKTGMEKFEQQLLPQTEQTSQDHIAQLNPQQPQVNGGSEELSKIQNYIEQIEQLIKKPGND